VSWVLMGLVCLNWPLLEDYFLFTHGLNFASPIKVSHLFHSIN
jgi:hypothetical protein